MGFGQHIHDDFDYDGIVITGDISECDRLEEELEAFWVGTKKSDVFFVLGNHDYYNGSFYEAEQVATRLNKLGIKWLSINEPIRLTDKACLVGQEGFYDALTGHRTQSRLLMNDFFLIKDFEPINAQRLNPDPLHRFGVMRNKSMNEADAAYKKLSAAAKNFKTVYFATHYPPFKESCFHQGAISDDTWLPYFTSVLMGEALMRVAGENPQTQFVVLCGHTHSEGVYMPIGNLVVRTGESEYRIPRVHEVFTIK